MERDIKALRPVLLDLSDVGDDVVCAQIHPSADTTLTMFLDRPKLKGWKDAMETFLPLGDKVGHETTLTFQNGPLIAYVHITDEDAARWLKAVNAILDGADYADDSEEVTEW